VEDASSPYDLSQLSPYEREAWDQSERWRLALADRQSRVPAAIRNRAKQVGEGASKAWKGTPGSSGVNEVMDVVLAGGYEALTDAVNASLRRERILQAAQRADGSVEDLSDLRSLDLSVIDEIRPSLNLRYAAASATTGAGSGLVAGGGSAAVLGTAGVAAAPGGLAVAGALGGDVVATIALASRVVTHYAGYYGYDTRERREGRTSRRHRSRRCRRRGSQAGSADSHAAGGDDGCPSGYVERAQ
jgi:hypothetical protein